MKTILRYLFLVFLLFATATCTIDSTSQKTRFAKGGVYYGGVLKVQSPERISEVFPLSGTNKYSRNISFQIFESLLRFDTKTMRTVPHIAKKFRVSPDGLTYFLDLRKDVYFHPNACFSVEKRRLNAHDVKFSLDFACSDLAINKSSFLLINRIKGAQTYHQQTKNKLTANGVSGIKVINEFQISIELNAPFAGFEKILTHSNLGMIAKEAYARYGNDIVYNPVGTGPFLLKEMTDEKVELERSSRYWRRDKHGNQLPYLDGFELRYYHYKKEELAAFQEEKTDLILNIPTNEINHLLGSLEQAQKGENVVHKLYSASSMSVMYIGFANESKEFSDIRVRKAFNMAINRTELVNNWLGGKGWPAKHGFLPPLDFYPNDLVKPLPYDSVAARKLLAQAGYPSGKNFPTTDIYVNAQPGSTEYQMVKGLVDQLDKNLGVKLKIKVCSINERDKAIAEGKAKMWRAGWIADYPHPESFLSLFYSRNISASNNTINSFRYKNATYDDILDAANKQHNEHIRNQLFVQCDQKIVDDAVVIPVLTGDYLILVNKKVKNFQPNPMEILDISSIFMKASRKRWKE